MNMEESVTTLEHCASVEKHHLLFRTQSCCKEWEWKSKSHCSDLLGETVLVGPQQAGQMLVFALNLGVR